MAGKVALIAAGEREVGQAIAARFAREGYEVALSVASSDSPDGEAQPFLRVPGNVRDLAEAERVAGEVVARLGRIDALVNYGAVRRVVGTIMDISDADFDEEMAADLKSVIVLSRAVIPHMAAGGGGAIVNISSIAREGVKGRALRSASKAALSSLTRAMALDHAHQKVRVNAILVGPTLTQDLVRRPEQVDALRGQAPLGELHTPADVAAAVYFLASDDACHITGALLPVDSGRSLPTF